MSDIDDKSYLWEKFYKTFHEDPQLWVLMQKYCFEAINAGWKRYSARTIFERIRWHVQVETNDPEFKINDHWPPYYSRAFMWAFPQHGPSCWRGCPPQQRPWGVRTPDANDGFFELRTIETHFQIERHLHEGFAAWRTRLRVDLPLQTETTEEDDMGKNKATTGPLELDLKKKKLFDGSTCAFKGCNKKPDGYVCAVRPTKGHPAGQLWFAPVCLKSVLAAGYVSEIVLSLAELAQRRSGASDLALVLDVEVGEVLKRLEAAGIDEKGVKLGEETPPEETSEDPPAEETDTTDAPEDNSGEQLPLTDQTTVVAEAPTDAIVAIETSITIPEKQILADNGDVTQLLGQLQNFNIFNQVGMDLAADFLSDVKGVWKRLEEIRKGLGRPLREKLQEIQDHFKPTQELLEQAEGVLKTKIAEGQQRAAQEQQQALLAAQQAHQQGNVQGMAIATQQAAVSDLTLPQGVTTHKVWRCRVINKEQLPGEFWMPNETLLQAYVDAGWREIPGVQIWEEDVVRSRAS